MKLLTATAIGLLATTTMAHAQENAIDLSRQADTVVEENAYQYEFDRDEQCQGYYWGVKRLGYENPCARDEDEDQVSAPVPMKVLNEYIVYFDFDKSNVREEDKDVLTQAARDISKYNPSKVLVAGYTDTRGSMDYNEALSARRANSVSSYLTSLGVSNFVVDEEALGETNLAVPTPDETKAQPNRRAVIQFIK